MLLFACDAGTKKPAPANEVTRREPPLQSPTSSAPPIADDAAAVVTVDAAVAAAPDAAVGAVGDIVITWLVFSSSEPAKDSEMPKQPVSLVITAGGGQVLQETKLQPQFGALYPYNQAWCHSEPSQYPLTKGELAKITFYEGGAGGYVIRRKGDALVVYSWAQTDGLCGSVDKPVECPKNEKQVASITVKAKPGAKVVEQILDVDAKGVRKPFDCSAR
ncbi:MAG TPA: hypothetical protein VL326_26745 [Kofleriaceae bacterium]|nr:hypothetical protein [Kofleriaceae bacterium]